jgi:hypothetical protein
MKFRKLPIIVEAEQWFPNTSIAGVVFDKYYNIDLQEFQIGPCLRTLEGTFEVNEGDWIITGVEGEKWPVKDSIFRKNYEQVE